jgi:hypothetical protein
MRVSRVAATVATIAIVSGCGVAHHGAAAVTHPTAPAVATSAASSPPATSRPVASASATSAPITSQPATSAPATSQSATSAPATSRPVASHPATSHPVAAKPTADQATLWLESAGGQAQVTFNQDVDVLAAALEIESHSDTVANHLVFEADARVVRAQARKILATPALLPTVNRAAYKVMLNDFITVADLLQPGPGYGTTAQDEAAWNAALIASNITVA